MNNNGHLDPAKRHDFVYLFDVAMGNPNGDPDAGNLPRIDPQTMKGIVTDVCLKRKIRDYVQLRQQDYAQLTQKNGKGYDIFIQSEHALNTLIERAAKDKVGFEPPKAAIDEELLEKFKEDIPDDFELDGNILTYTGEVFKEKNVKEVLLKGVTDKDLKNKIGELVKTLAKSAKDKLTPEKRSKTREELIRRYYDIRLFGAVLSTGLNAGQVRGPMQLTFSQSIDPIFPMDLAITRVAITREEDKSKKATEMGRKSLIPYGLYMAHGFYNPFMGNSERGTGVTEDDLKIFWDGMINMFELNRTSSKGLMSCRGLYVFSHESQYGNYPAHKLFDLIKPEKQDGVDQPRSFSDYKPIEIDNLPDNVTPWISPM